MFPGGGGATSLKGAGVVGGGIGFVGVGVGFISLFVSAILFVLS